MFWFKCSQNRRNSYILSTSLYFSWLLKLILQVILREVYFSNRMLLNFRIVQVRRRITTSWLRLLHFLLILVSQLALWSVVRTFAGLFGYPMNCIYHLLKKKTKLSMPKVNIRNKTNSFLRKFIGKKNLHLPQPVLCREPRGHFPPSTAAEHQLGAACCLQHWPAGLPQTLTFVLSQLNYNHLKFHQILSNHHTRTP